MTNYFDVRRHRRRRRAYRWAMHNQSRVVPTVQSAPQPLASPIVPWDRRRAVPKRFRIAPGLRSKKTRHKHNHKLQPNNRSKRVHWKLRTWKRFNRINKWRKPFQAHCSIRCSGNNTLRTLWRKRHQSGGPETNTLCVHSAGKLGLRGARRGTPFAAESTGRFLALDAVLYGVSAVDVTFHGKRARVSACVRGLRSGGLQVLSRQHRDKTPHNGCRRPKARRV